MLKNNDCSSILQSKGDHGDRNLTTSIIREKSFPRYKTFR